MRPTTLRVSLTERAWPTRGDVTGWQTVMMSRTRKNAVRQGHRCKGHGHGWADNVICAVFTGIYVSVIISEIVGGCG